MNTDVEHSEFGYWIRPDGKVIPMDGLQVHDKWIIENTVFDRVFDEPTDATDYAVLQGWIAVSFGPDEASCGIRVRKEAVTKRAAHTLRRAITQAGFDKRDIYADIIAEIGGASERRSGPGEDIADQIVKACWDDEVHPDPTIAVDILSARVNKLRLTGSRRALGVAALEAGAVPDVTRVFAELRTLDPIRTRVRKAVYGWSNEGYEAKRRGDVDFLHKALVEVRMVVLEGIRDLENAGSRARSALYGISDPPSIEVSPEWLPVPALLPGEAPLAALPRLAAAEADALTRMKMGPGPIDVAPEPFRDPMRKIETWITGFTIPAISLSGHIRRLDDTLAKEGMSDAKAVYDAMLYYLCHECGRSTVNPISLERIREPLAALREAIASHKDGSEPPPTFGS